jgi:hypothetical protein
MRLMGFSGISRKSVMFEGAKTLATEVSACVLPQIIGILL